MVDSEDSKGILLIFFKNFDRFYLRDYFNCYVYLSSPLMFMKLDLLYLCCTNIIVCKFNSL